MKTKLITLLLIMSCSLCMAQKKPSKKTVPKKEKTESVKKEKEWILDEDVKSINGKRVIMNMDLYVTDADNELKKVNFGLLCDSIRYKDHGMNASTMNKMIIKSNYSAMKMTKNIYTYVPKQINAIYDMKEYRWLVVVSYTAQNDYGATKNGNITSVFDGFGTYLDSYSLSDY